MHYITRSQWYTGCIKQFIESNDKELYLELYPREVTKLQKNYPNLSILMLGMVKAHSADQRYHVLIEK